jgi:hypothetical protein
LVATPSDYIEMYSSYYDDPTVYDLETLEKTGQDPKSSFSPVVIFDSKQLVSGRSSLDAYVNECDSKGKRFGEITWYMNPFLIATLFGFLILFSILLFLVAMRRK